MSYKKINANTVLPRKFWVRIHNLLLCEERASVDTNDLKDNPDIRKTLIDLVFFPEVFN